MAQRDRNQGFGFMYVDITKLLEQKKDLTQTQENPILTDNVKTVNFNKDKTVPAPTPTENVGSHIDRQAAITQIKQNLDRLQSLHHKLHAMLDELNKAANKTPKTNS